MKFEFPYNVAIKFPSELEYIPLVRKFISEILQVLNFGSRFSFRSELIVDEICNNAVCYGSSKADAMIEFVCVLHEDRVEFKVNDQGGSQENRDKLRKAIEADGVWNSIDKKDGHGLELVRMLAQQVECKIDEGNNTSIHIVRKREDS